MASFHSQEKCLEKVRFFEIELSSNPLLLILKLQDAKFPLFNEMQKNNIIVLYRIFWVIFHLSSARCSLHSYHCKKGNTTILR